MDSDPGEHHQMTPPSRTQEEVVAQNELAAASENGKDSDLAITTTTLLQYDCQNLLSRSSHVKITE
jgi:hypothetical protein